MGIVVVLTRPSGKLLVKGLVHTRITPKLPRDRVKEDAG
jgi:hypothetical protein